MRTLIFVILACVTVAACKVPSDDAALKEALERAARAEASLNDAIERAATAETKTEYERNRADEAARRIPILQGELDSANNNYSSASADLQRAKAKIREFEAKFERVSVRGLTCNLEAAQSNNTSCFSMVNAACKEAGFAGGDVNEHTRHQPGSPNWDIDRYTCYSSWAN